MSPSSCLALPVFRRLSHCSGKQLTGSLDITPIDCQPARDDAHIDRMRVRGEPVLECALSGGGLAKRSKRSAAIGEEACPHRTGQIFGKLGGVVENLLITLRDELGFRPELDDLLVD